MLSNDEEFIQKGSTKNLEETFLFSKYNRHVIVQVVVDRSQNTRDFHFPPRIKAEISEYASNYAVSNYA